MHPRIGGASSERILRDRWKESYDFSIRRPAGQINPTIHILRQPLKVYDRIIHLVYIPNIAQAPCPGVSQPRTGPSIYKFLDNLRINLALLDGPEYNIPKMFRCCFFFPCGRKSMASFCNCQHDVGHCCARGGAQVLLHQGRVLTLIPNNSRDETIISMMMTMDWIHVALLSTQITLYKSCYLFRQHNTHWW